MNISCVSQNNNKFTNYTKNKQRSRVGLLLQKDFTKHTSINTIIYDTLVATKGAQSCPDIGARRGLNCWHCVNALGKQQNKQIITTIGQNLRISVIVYFVFVR